MNNNNNNNNKVFICGPVKNCAPFLDKVFENINKIGALFDEYNVFLYYDKSNDDTLKKCIAYQHENQERVSVYVNTNPVSRFRTHRIASARNACLKRIREKYSDYPYFIMMDFDDPNCKNINISVLKKYVVDTLTTTPFCKESEWDALSFNTAPKYYDIWGLSIYPFCFSYNHFNSNQQFYGIIQNYVSRLLDTLPSGHLLPCISAFNGFAIYKTRKFLDCKYDGRPRLDLIPKRAVYAHMKATQSPIIFKVYGNDWVNGVYEDCEHRAFHGEAIKKHGAKIRISPDILFG